ncbi:MAG: Gfo/Idh/MocA family oxidoreductase [Rhodoferax sp.]|nr:Gfo/Idh/MocA family oxidoreductase [Rhodoferax sp.]
MTPAPEWTALQVLPALRVGLIGTGFIAAFHLQSMVGVRNVTIGGVYSRSVERRTRIAQQARALGLGPAQVFESLQSMLMSGEVDAVWLLTPNDTRLEIMREIHRLTKAGAPIRAVACEKPLARTLAEAREMLRLAEDAGLLHGYLENQVFSTAVMRGKDIIWRRAVPQGGRPYLARAAEEHSGPHEPWFWQGERQGGGVLSDMMCHSVEVSRYLLTPPGEGREVLKLLSASATTANLKWTRPRYAADLQQRMGIDFARRPVEDFARGILTLEDADQNQLIIEATTSWAYVGAGLRIQLELLGPEYSMEFSSLSTGLKVFLSRSVSGAAGEDLLEKQNSEQGLMPVIDDEAGLYGYTDENRHMVEAFRRGVAPMETFHDGVGVVEMLMGLYRSAELGRTVQFPDAELETYVPQVARA